MTPRVHRVLSGLSLAALATVAVGSTASPALAASGDVEVVNTETVQIYTSPTGSVEESRVYEQLSMFGNGAVDVKNPVSTDGLRNLNGFGGFDVKDGDQVIKTTVDGTKKVRTVSSYDGTLPLDVKVAYKLDGKSVKPGDVVGGDGKLEVVYTVENITGKSQEVTVPDGRGGTVTKTAEVSIPIVGSLTTTAPPNFTNVESEQANRAGDGKGGTKLSFTMTLFPPIGSPTAVFGYTADIRDGVIPRADISALPVNPLDVPTFKSANASYQGGADTGAKLTDGAVQIDDNLLKLRDGAGDLLAGLIKLRDGASELNAGLSGKAAPGAQKLATGAGDLNDGLGQIDDGAGKLSDGTGALADGANKLSAGAGKAADGSGRLYNGTKDLSAGATKVSKGANTLDGFMKQLSAGQGDLLEGLRLLESGVQALPDTVAEKLKKDMQYQALLQALKGISDGIGNRGDAPTAGTILGGLNGIQYGLRYPGKDTDCEAPEPSECGALDATDAIAKQFKLAMDGPAGAPGTLATVKATIQSIKGSPDCGAVCKGTTDAVAAGIESALRTQLTAARDGLLSVSSKVDVGILGPIVIGNPRAGALDQLRAGLSRGDAAACLSVPNSCGIKQGTDFLRLYGIPALTDGLAKSIRTTLIAGISAPEGGCTEETKTLICGAQALQEGGAQLAGGTGDPAAGAGELSDGAGLLSSKTGELADGLGQISDGAGQLSDGSGKLDAGAKKLADGVSKAFDGSGLLADGAQTLSDGLQDAANGSGRLAEGLGTAADGAPKLKNGAQKLSDQGTKKLIAAGESTTQSYGEMVAVMKAGAERADAEKMAYGAPANAVGLTAYSYVIQGDDGETGRNWARGLGGLALLGAGGGVFALRRRIL